MQVFGNMMKQNNRKSMTFVSDDPLLAPYALFVDRRVAHALSIEKQLTQNRMDLIEFASGHQYFGLHPDADGWILREWAPNATEIHLIGEMTDWQKKQDFTLQRVNSVGVWELRLPHNAINHGMLYRLRVAWKNHQPADRLPAYAQRVVQDRETLIFNAQVWQPPIPYQWQKTDFIASRQPLFVYETHVGMAQDAEKIGSFPEFTEKIIPRIVAAGYNTIQLMAVQEHPYYGSFGYQVSNFFAVSSRFGTPEELKALVDTAHSKGLRVIMDLIHSHAVINEVEGLSRFDGTCHQYFHAGPRGYHQAWDSRCFDYGKTQVLHFLLSNCRFWLEEYRFDGFRFDGVTSMLYLDHGLGKQFTSYADYFGESVDEDAYTYLALANKLIHSIRPDAITIAEDISGMPGLAVPNRRGGAGFDYRFAMGIADNWIRMLKDEKDEHWQLGHLWYELTNRRADEKTISYAESHDQSLVGDQTLIFRLIGSDMYDHMSHKKRTLKVDRGIALHKLIRLITIATAGAGYLNFMGNEFGHPEWIDFPREGNEWSFRYARRQWHLADDKSLLYGCLAKFDQDMLGLIQQTRILDFSGPYLTYEHIDDKVIVFERGTLLFVFNFHPSVSYKEYRFQIPPGSYQMIMNSDVSEYGGHDRLTANQIHYTLNPSNDPENKSFLQLYLPTRTAMVLQPNFANHVRKTPLDAWIDFT
jgi:1,4-alpha-glucan branching enzyme